MATDHKVYIFQFLMMGQKNTKFVDPHLLISILWGRDTCITR